MKGVSREYGPHKHVSKGKYMVVREVSNEEVCRRMEEDTELITTIKAYKLEYFGLIMRNEGRYGLLQNILQGDIPGKLGPGRQRNSGLRS
ncbi:hypothetical protein Trydic_g3076 [Trypoxylus dichotomus]